jgi:DNA primase
MNYAEAIISRLSPRKVRKTKNGYLITCPFSYKHSRGDRVPSFSISYEGVYYCFGCGEKGNFITLCKEFGFDDLLREFLGIKEKKRKHKEAKNGNVGNVENEIFVGNLEWRDRHAIDCTRLNFEVKADFREVFEIYERSVGIYHQYLEKRGIDKDTAMEWELGYDSKTDRVTFPIRDYRGNLVGISGRSVSDEEPKYYHFGHFERNKVLYGEYKACKMRGALIVVEGFFDVISLMMKGYRAVGTLGTPSDMQIEKIKMIADEQVIIWFDSDIAGVKSSWRLRNALGDSKIVRVVSSEKDPDEYSKEEVRNILS